MILGINFAGIYLSNAVIVGELGPFGLTPWNLPDFSKFFLILFCGTSRNQAFPVRENHLYRLQKNCHNWSSREDYNELVSDLILLQYYYIIIFISSLVYNLVYK